MTEILADIFSQCDPDEIDKVCYLSLGVLAPKFANLEFNLAEKMMIRAVAQSTNKPITEITSIFKETGDLGEVIYKILEKSSFVKRTGIPNMAESQNRDSREIYNTKISSKEKATDNNPTINQVYSSLVTIANYSGTGSQEQKINGIVALLKQLDPLSAKYLIRIPIKKLRLGFSDMTIIDALSWMQTGDKSLRKPIEQAFNVLTDIGEIANIFKSEGLEGIEKVIPKPGKPIRPAKATPLLDPEDILSKMDQQAALEPKYDGFRVQIHMDKSRTMPHQEVESLFATEPKPFVAIYSRNLDNITHMFPELVEAIQNFPVNSIIIDGEAVATDSKTGKMLDFQETIKRKRKHNIDQVASQIPLTAFIFDIMYLNGQSTMCKTVTERRQILEEVFKDAEHKAQNKQDSTIQHSAFSTLSLQLTRQTIVTNIKDFNTYFKQMSEEKLEGLMAKKIDAPYRAGARDFTWVKYKVGMQSDMADTVDAIIMGYFKGQGKWTQFGLGKLLIGVRDGDKVIALSKVGSGLSEERIKELVLRLEKIRLDEKPESFQVDKTLIPDIWVEPSQVIEIRADSISKSSFYSTGLSLRFPRFIRFRDDKSTEDATSIKELQVISGDKS